MGGSWFGFRFPRRSCVTDAREEGREQSKNSLFGIVWNLQSIKKTPQPRKSNNNLQVSARSTQTVVLLCFAMQFRRAVWSRRREAEKLSQASARGVAKKIQRDRAEDKSKASRKQRGLCLQTRQRLRELLSSLPRVCLHNPHPRLWWESRGAIWKVPLGCWSKDNWSQVYSEFLVFAFGAKFSSSAPGAAACRDVTTPFDTLCTGPEQFYSSRRFPSRHLTGRVHR